MDLSALVTTVERLLRRLVGANVEMAVSVREGVTVDADPPSLEQVLVNLVVNARDAMPHGGRLDVRVDARTGAQGSPDVAILEVRDSGTGMDAETRRHVFDPFFTTKAHGTGLGLASSYGIVRQHDGDIVVESEPGRGSCFRVLLPLRAPAPTGAKPQKPAAVAAARRGVVLVVDDEDLVRNTTSRLVASLGYDVLTAASAAEALERAAGHPGPIDVMVCDVAMPGGDGPSLARRLLADRPELRVVFVSGFADDTSGVTMDRATFLAKPYGRAELLEKLTEVAPP